MGAVPRACALGNYMSHPSGALDRGLMSAVADLGCVPGALPFARLLRPFWHRACLPYRVRNETQTNSMEETPVTDNQNRGDMPRIEDYGIASTDDADTGGKQAEGTATDNQNTGDMPRIEDYGIPNADEPKTGGRRAGGTEGTEQGGGRGEQFGEWGNSGTGTDLTREMDEMGPQDVKSGLVKGGQTGKDEVGGPARYGGESGSLTGEQQ